MNGYIRVTHNIDDEKQRLIWIFRRGRHLSYQRGKHTTNPHTRYESHSGALPRETLGKNGI